jgi:hypothetical protein
MRCVKKEGEGGGSREGATLRARFGTGVRGGREKVDARWRSAAMFSLPVGIIWVRQRSLSRVFRRTGSFGGDVRVDDPVWEIVKER